MPSVVSLEPFGAILDSFGFGIKARGRGENSFVVNVGNGGNISEIGWSNCDLKTLGHAIILLQFRNPTSLVGEWIGPFFFDETQPGNASSSDNQDRQSRP